MSDQPEQSFGSFEPSTMSGGGNAFIPIAIALAGAVVGIVAIIVALTRSGPSDALTAELETLRQTNLALTARISELEKFKASAARENPERKVNELQTSVQTAFNQVEAAFTQTNQRVSANSEKIAEVVKTLNEWATRGSTPTATRSTATTQTRGTAPTEVSGAGGTTAAAREHTIESGDTFSRLAKRYNVSISAILEANPDVDPRRLLPGQRIRIPAP